MYWGKTEQQHEAVHNTIYTYMYTQAYTITPQKAADTKKISKRIKCKVFCVMGRPLMRKNTNSITTPTQHTHTNTHTQSHKSICWFPADCNYVLTTIAIRFTSMHLVASSFLTFVSLMNDCYSSNSKRLATCMCMQRRTQGRVPIQTNREAFCIPLHIATTQINSP